MDINTLRTHLADTLQKLKQVEADYSAVTEAMEKHFADEFPELAAQRTAAADAMLRLSQRAKDFDHAVRHWIKPADDLPDELSVSRHVVAEYDPDELRDWCIQNNVTWLLKVDERAVQTLIHDTAIEAGDEFVMPGYLQRLFPAWRVKVVTERRIRISKPKLLKADISEVADLPDTVFNIEGEEIPLDVALNQRLTEVWFTREAWEHDEAPPF